eukprot:9284252-Alexandrium_andersonii.AAC.1
MGPPRPKSTSSRPSASLRCSSSTASATGATLPRRSSRRASSCPQSASWCAPAPGPSSTSPSLARTASGRIASSATWPSPSTWPPGLGS